MTDPRRKGRGNFRHKLTDIIFLTIAAVVSGADDWKTIATFGKGQEDWLKKYGDFENGTPSHDTLGRIFAALDPSEFSKCFSSWTKQISKLTKGEIVAIDGKRLRGSYDNSEGKLAIHSVSAFASENNICLGQVSCDEKSNEITAIPKLLDIIDIKHSTVTIDAMGCQKEIAKKIIDKQGNYLLAVKENQKELLEQIKKVFEISGTLKRHEDIDSGHGRVEKRICTVTDDLRFLDVSGQWAGIKSVVKIESERFTKVSGKTQNEQRYYISSLNADPKPINTRVRNHWGVENKLHWMLDVEFKEDSSRRRKGNSAENYNVIAKTALTLISKDESKNSKKGKRFLAAIDPKFREILLKV
jgi:predicted transposase YbfD/YdcC